ncbi:MAG: SMC domain-containing protein [Gemmatales bacterium]|nr:MAG: SMC domain-containing protein [Gemmatales bacterium]
MFIRSIEIENWRCIGKLQLNDLPDGIVVLYGPNRTGKSSLLEAVRGCLFDFEPTTKSADVMNARPWNKNGEPSRLSVAFETRGQRYRITKVLAGGRGKGSLEKWQHGRWQLVTDTPRTAAQETRKLLEANKSMEGLGQLLWLDQGNFRLPKTGFDGTLQEKLVQVIRSMLTPRDLAFQQALQARWEKWFGQQGHRRTSPVVLAKKELAERRKKLEEMEAEYRRAEETIRAMERFRSREIELAAKLEQAETKINTLAAERERIQDRLSAYEIAQRELAEAEKAMADALKQIQRYETCRKACQESEQRVKELEGIIIRLNQEHAQHAQVDQQKQAELEALCHEESQRHEAWQRLEAKRRLLELNQKEKRLQTALEQREKLEQARLDFERKLDALPAISSTVLEELRQRHKELVRLRAQRDAAAWKLIIRATEAAEASVALDTQPPRNVAFVPGKAEEWTLHRQVRIHIAGFGDIELARQSDHMQVDELLRRLDNATAEFAQQIKNLGENPDDENCVERLADRVREREALTQTMRHSQAEINRLDHEIRDICANRSADTTLTEISDERQKLLAQQPELASAPLSIEEVEKEQLTIRTEIQDVRRRLETCRQEVQSVKQLLEALNKQLNETNQKRASAEAALAEQRKTWADCGPESTLLEQKQRAEEARRQAQAKLDSLQLTPEEQAINARLASAKEEKEKIRHEHDDVVKQLYRLRGILEKCEGLHLKRSEAASAVKAIDENLAQEELEADAHNLLKSTFETCREQQVEQVISPIAERVLEWAHELGLDDYRAVHFDDQFLPQTVVREGSGGRLVDFQQESFGTEEQLNLLVRLVLGGIVAQNEPAVAILDDPLVHSDALKHERLLEILRRAAAGGKDWNPPAGPLQILILTCHPDRFAHLPDAKMIDLQQAIIPV